MMDITTVIIAAVVVLSSVVTAQNDFSDPIKCYYCLGPAENSTCADPVNPRVDKGVHLKEIDCEHGICLKWTYYWQNVLYMHRTCSHRLNHFRIMMIDGVCRSERMGNGYLCMCGKHLCNSANHHRHQIAYSHVLSVILTLVFAFQRNTLEL